MTPDTRTKLRLADLAQRTPTTFTIIPDAEARATLATSLGILGIKKLRFEGQIAPLGRSDWQLDALLGATVVQTCVVTLEPVTTRIDEAVTRRYLADMPDPEGTEIEMPEDDEADPLPRVLDLSEVMAEALSLALPLFPRAPDAALEATQFAEEGVTPMTDDDAKPFAGLQGLADKLKKQSEDGS